jgi:hypothetical protein
LKIDVIKQQRCRFIHQSTSNFDESTNFVLAKMDPKSVDVVSIGSF